MSNIQIKKGVSSVTRDTSDGGFLAVRGTRDGALYSADWYDALALEGRVFTVNGATGTTQQTFGGAFSATAGDLSIDIPDGTIAIPLYINVTLQTMTAGLTEVIAIASSTLTAVSAGTAVYAKNVRIDQPIKSVTTCYASVDAASMTSPYAGDYVEFFRSGYPTDNSLTLTPIPTYIWSARQHGPPPIVADGGSITVYVGAAASTGFISATWVELPESFIK